MALGNSSSNAQSYASIPCTAFLAAYPFPAFILQDPKPHGQNAPSLNPVFGNSSFRSLVFGPDADTAELGVAFLRALKTVDASKKMANWLAFKRETESSQVSSTITIDLFLSWTEDVSTLELTQSVVEGFVICTSTPRSPLPVYAPATTSESSGSSLVRRRGKRSSMHLPDFPPRKSMRTSSRSPPDSYSPERLPLDQTVLSAGVSKMREMIDNHPWHLTPLGPRSKWSISLRTMLDYILSSPFPMTLWWGSEVVLLYNDAYMEMAGSKHPQIFAERGSVAWGELWETIGPLAHKCLEGESVAKVEDLLFFNRLTGAKLPEEVYHNWSFIPVRDDDGKFSGLVNTTFETTSKVLAERRFLFLRDLGNQAGLARTQAEFWSTVMDVVRPFSLDVPFAAFYFVSAQESNGRTLRGSRTSYIRSKGVSPIKVQLRRAGAIGIPETHSSAPQYLELLLDPLTFFPSPQGRNQTSPDLPATSPQGSNPLEKSRIDSMTLHDQLFTTSQEGSASPFPPKGSSALSSGFSSDTIGPMKSSRTVIWPFDEAFGTRRAVLMEDVPDFVVEGFEIRGWGEHARQAVIIPIIVDNDDLPSAIIVMGLNSRRPYDKEYSDWIDLLRLSLNSLLTAVKGREADAIRAEHLAELDRAKTTFFSNASHELRTPLTLIQGPLNDCLSLVEDKNAKEKLKMAARNVVRLSRLVDSLMDFSKLAANRLEGRFRPVQLGPFTADLASLFRSVIEKSSIEFIVECDMDELRLCYVDIDFWEKIVFNLIGNAFKYTMRGQIRVMVEYDREFAYLHVQDTGVGIPNSDIKRVFDRFHRVEAISRSHEGTGIGLSLTKELVKLHGGTLSVQSISETDSQDAHGSTFTVTLPIGKDHLPAAHIVTDIQEAPSKLLYGKGVVDEATTWDQRAPEERTPSEASDSGGSSEGRKSDSSTLFFTKDDVVLLVDDNSDMRRYISSLLSPYCKVVQACNGVEALQIADKVQPNLVLSDVMMPVLDGYGLIQRLRQRPETKLTPIIIVTARESEENKIEGLLSGADDYMSKPFTGRELIARVHLQMQLGKRRIELEEKFIGRTREIQLLSDLSPVGIVRVDEYGSVNYTNSKWWEISGLEATSQADAWINQVEQDDREPVIETWNSAIDFKQSSSIEFKFKNGRYAKAYFESLFAENGAPRGMLGTLTDVSDQRMLEAANLAHAQEQEGTARRRAEEAEARRQEADERRSAQELLIDVTSHELRQPVSAILNCSSLVRTNLTELREELRERLESRNTFEPSSHLLKDIDEDLEALDAIYQCGLAQERIANDVLSLSRIQLQVLTIQHVDFDVIEEVQQLASVFKNELKMKQINLELKFGSSFENIGRRISSDKARFIQVITNLLSNAIKFTDTSTNKRDIVIRLDISRFAPVMGAPCIPPENEVSQLRRGSHPLDVYVFVSVTDSGPGIMLDDLNLLFQRFQQGSYSHKVFGGSGLGLFVSRKLCDLMGGRIDVDSVYGEGATFRLFIKARLVETRGPNDVHDSYQERYGSALPAPKHPEPPAVPMHILITEDNLINQARLIYCQCSFTLLTSHSNFQRVLSRQLLKAGHTVEVASNGQQALDAIKDSACSSSSNRRPFDVILMDCEMPVMDGLTAVRELRILEASNELPRRNRVIALTGNARAGQIQSARDAGMDDVIIKPYKIDELLNVLQQQEQGG